MHVFSQVHAKVIVTTEVMIIRYDAVKYSLR